MISAILATFSLMIFFGTVIAEGVGTNAIFELVFSTAVCIGLSVENFSKFKLKNISIQKIFFALITLRLVSTLHHDPYFLLFSSQYNEDIRRRVGIFETEITRVKGISGPVRCSVESVCVIAGKDKTNDGSYLTIDNDLRCTIKQ